MSRTLSDIFYKIVIGLIIVAIVIGVRDAIITDQALSAWFGELLGELPFANAVAEPVMKALGFRTSVPFVTGKSFMSELLKLAVMACLQPLVLGIAFSIFLPMPRVPRNQILATPLPSWYGAEEYTETIGYKIKKLLLSLVLCPPLALLSGWLIGKGQDYLENEVGGIFAVLASIGVLAAVVILSLIPLLLVGVGLGIALIWRFLVTLLSQMANTMVMNALCIAVYFAFISGVWSRMAGTISLLVVWLIVFDIFTTAMRQVIVS